MRYKCKLCGNLHIEYNGQKFCPEFTSAVLGRLRIKRVTSALIRDAAMTAVINLPLTDIGKTARLVMEGGTVDSPAIVNALWKAGLVSVVHSADGWLDVVLNRWPSRKVKLYVIAIEDQRGNTEVVTINQVGIAEAAEFIAAAYPPGEFAVKTVKEIKDE